MVCTNGLLQSCRNRCLYISCPSIYHPLLSIQSSTQASVIRLGVYADRAGEFRLCSISRSASDQRDGASHLAVASVFPPAPGQFESKKLKKAATLLMLYGLGSLGRFMGSSVDIYESGVSPYTEAHRHAKRRERCGQTCDIAHRRRVTCACH